MLCACTALWLFEPSAATAGLEPLFRPPYPPRSARVVRILLPATRCGLWSDGDSPSLAVRSQPYRGPRLPSCCVRVPSASCHIWCWQCACFVCVTSCFFACPLPSVCFSAWWRSVRCALCPVLCRVPRLVPCLVPGRVPCRVPCVLPCALQCAFSCAICLVPHAVCRVRCRVPGRAPCPVPGIVEPDY